MQTQITKRRRPPAIQAPPERSPRTGVRTSARGSVRPVDFSLFPEDLFCSQNLCQSDETTIMVSRVPAHERGPRAHYHQDEDQFFLTLRGELQLDLGAEAYTLRPGSLAFIPAGTNHRHYNVGDVDELHLEILVPGFSIMNPPRMGYVDEGSEWEAGGSVAVPPDESTWWEPAPGARVFVYSDPSGARDPAVPDSKRATIFATRARPGSGKTQTHLHRFDQYYYVISGILEIEMGLDTYEVGPDSLVIIPAGVPHRNRAVGDSICSHVTLNVPVPPRPNTPDDPWDISVNLEVVPRR